MKGLSVTRLDKVMEEGARGGVSTGMESEGGISLKNCCLAHCAFEIPRRCSRAYILFVGWAIIFLFIVSV